MGSRARALQLVWGVSEEDSVEQVMRPCRLEGEAEVCRPGESVKGLVDAGNSRYEGGMRSHGMQVKLRRASVWARRKQGAWAGCAKNEIREVVCD